MGQNDKYEKTLLFYSNTRVKCDPPEQRTLNTGPPSKYTSPLDLLILDKNNGV